MLKTTAFRVTYTAVALITADRTSSNIRVRKKMRKLLKKTSFSHPQWFTASFFVLNRKLFYHWVSLRHDVSNDVIFTLHK